MVAAALEAPRELLPYLPELLIDLQALGSDPRLIAGLVRDLPLPASPRILDLGCGKGAVSIAIATALQLPVVGVDLFAPFVAQARAAAHTAGVGQLCQFHHGDARTVPAPSDRADVAVFAALGDVLGAPASTMGVLRQHVRPGGFVVLSDVYRAAGDAPVFPGFEHYLTRDDTVRGLTAWGDTLVREVLSDDDDDDSNGEAAAIARRAQDLAARHPQHRDLLLAFAAHQAAAESHIAEHLADAVWVLQRAGE